VVTSLRRKRAVLPAGEEAGSASLADEILDEILPEEIDWRQLVRSYPKSTLTLAAVAGFLLGRSRGRKLIHDVTQFVADSVDEGLNEFLGREPR